MKAIPLYSQKRLILRLLNSVVPSLRVSGVMHRGTRDRLELLGFCSPFRQFNGVPPTSLGGGWPRTLSFLGMPTVLVVAVSSHNFLPRDEIVDMRCLFYAIETLVREAKCTGASRLRVLLGRLPDVIQWDPMVRGLGPRNHPLVNFKIWLPARNITGTNEKRFFLYKKQSSQNSLWPMNFLRSHQLLCPP